MTDPILVVNNSTIPSENEESQDEFGELKEKTLQEHLSARRRDTNQIKNILTQIQTTPYQELQTQLQEVINHILLKQNFTESDNFKYPDEGVLRENCSKALQLSYGGFTEIAKLAGFTDEIDDFDLYFQEKYQEDSSLKKTDFSFFVLLEDGANMAIISKPYDDTYEAIYRSLLFKNINNTHDVYKDSIQINFPLKIGEQLILNIPPFNENKKNIFTQVKKIYVKKHLIASVFDKSKVVFPLFRRINISFDTLLQLASK